MAYRYSTKIGENMAMAVSQSLPVSRKLSTQVCRFVKGMPIVKAKQALHDVMKFKRAVPMKRYYNETAHKTGMAVGRYPVKACQQVLNVIESAEANAQFKGLSSADLIVYHAVAQKGPTMRGQGRTGGYMKRTHVEIVLSSSKAPDKSKKVESKKQTKPEVKKETPKQEKVEVKATPKPAVKKEIPKQAEVKAAPKQETKAVPKETPAPAKPAAKPAEPKPTATGVKK